MTNEQRFFIQILSDHLNGRKTEARSGLDWDALRSYADKHQVSGIVYQQCREFVPAECAEDMDRKHATELFYYHNRVALHAQVKQALSRKKIDFYTVKGLDVAALYPIPALRTMGDCDIVVHPADKDKAHVVMSSLGFETFLKEDKDWMYFKNDIQFEIHDHLLYKDPGTTRESREAVELAWEHVQPTGDGTRYALDWSFHFLFLLLHIKKHLIHQGIGFRQFMDLAVVMKNCELDWAWIERSLDELELRRFAEICFRLIERWFETPLPFPCEPMSDAFFEEATEKIFANGIFGFHDAENRQIGSLNAITQKSGPRWLVRAENIAASVFPNYRSMRFAEAYRFVDGRPWLLPLAWGYRFYRAIRYRLADNGLQMIERTMVSDELLDERERELEKWGLR